MRKLLALNKLEEALKQGKSPDLASIQQNNDLSTSSNNWKPAVNAPTIPNNMLLHKINSMSSANNLNTNQLQSQANHLLRTQQLSNFLKANNLNLNHFNKNNHHQTVQNTPIQSTAQTPTNALIQSNNQVQNALANIPTLLALKAMALQKAQNIRPT
ncbi:unnamed protein product, partial [Allacma fusca]